MIPPTVLNLSKRDDTAAAVAATTMEVMMTILDGQTGLHIGWGAYVECPREKKVPTVTGCWPVASRRRVIRSMAWRVSLAVAWILRTYRNMVRVKCMPQSEGIGKHSI